MELNLMRDCKFDLLLNTTGGGSTAGTTDVTCQNCVDMAGYDSILIGASLGPVVAAGYVKLVPTLASSSGATFYNSSGTDVHGNAIAAGSTATTTDMSETLLLCDLYQPSKRWVSALVDKASQNVTVDSVWAIRYNRNGKHPVAQASTVMYGVSFASFSQYPTTS